MMIKKTPQPVMAAWIPLGAVLKLYTRMSHAVVVRQVGCDVDGEMWRVRVVGVEEW